MTDQDVSSPEPTIGVKRRASSQGRNWREELTQFLTILPGQPGPSTGHRGTCVFCGLTFRMRMDRMAAHFTKTIGYGVKPCQIPDPTAVEKAREYWVDVKLRASTKAENRSTEGSFSRSKLMHVLKEDPDRSTLQGATGSGLGNDLRQDPSTRSETLSRWLSGQNRDSTFIDNNIMSVSTGEDQILVGDFVNFLNEVWTPFHAVAEAKRRLLEAGFEELDEAKPLRGIRPGGKYFFTRNMSSVVAFAVGGKYRPGNGFIIAGAHTDSPCPKLKPVSKSEKSGFLSVGVQPYGRGLWHTWFDRDLGLAGRAIVRHGNGVYSHELVKISRPILRIPNLAIHLTKGTERTSFAPNIQGNFYPILATQVKATLGCHRGTEKSSGTQGITPRVAPETTEVALESAEVTSETTEVALEEGADL
ncbi:unnamed protein product, partial [Choristocarpus tenellus]